MEEKTKIRIEGILEIPDGISVTYNLGEFTVKGPKGEVKRKLHNPKIKIELKENKILLTPKNKPTKREKKLINTFKAHLKNMFKGVTEGHLYELKVCSGHFPMTVTVKGELFEVKNFLGENIPRTLKISPNVKVNVNGDIVTVEGINKEEVAQTAANIEQLCRRPGFDTRIFQDGIYITKKDGKKIS